MDKQKEDDKKHKLRRMSYQIATKTTLRGDLKNKFLDYVADRCEMESVILREAVALLIKNISK